MNSCTSGEIAAEIAVNTVNQFIEEHPGKLNLVEWNIPLRMRLMADRDYKAFIVEGEAREPLIIDKPAPLQKWRDAGFHFSQQGEHILPQKQEIVVCHQNRGQPVSLNQILDVLPGALQDCCRSLGVNHIFLDIIPEQVFCDWQKGSFLTEFRRGDKNIVSQLQTVSTGLYRVVGLHFTITDKTFPLPDFHRIGKN